MISFKSDWAIKEDDAANARSRKCVVKRSKAGPLFYHEGPAFTSPPGFDDDDDDDTTLEDSHFREQFTPHSNVYIV